MHNVNIRFMSENVGESPFFQLTCRLVILSHTYLTYFISRYCSIVYPSLNFMIYPSLRETLYITIFVLILGLRIRNKD